MEDLNALLAILSGILMRLGIPFAATAVIIFTLRKLDNRWKAEAVENMKTSHKRVVIKPCWEINQCSPEKMKDCIAYQNQNSPCWQLFRTDQGILKEKCLGCEVFSQAPLPIGD